MKNSVFLTLSVASLVLAFSSCTKEPLDNLTADESRIYITNHDSTVAFSNYSTFSVADSAAVISNNHQQGGELTDVDAAYINAVKTQFQALGYTLVARDANPDLGITVSRVYNTSTGVFQYPDYWGYYTGYWDPYYWGYPGYNYYFPSYYGVYQIEEGAISIDMLDLKNASANNNEIREVWSGLIRGSGVFNTSKADSQVAALLDQSAYLEVTP